MNKELEMTPNVLVEFLQKPASEFTKEDIIRYIYEKDIQMVNFMYPAGDGRLKTLNFVINNAAYLDAIWSDLYRTDHLPIDVVISPEREVARAALQVNVAKEGRRLPRSTSKALEALIG